MTPNTMCTTSTVPVRVISLFLQNLDRMASDPSRTSSSVRIILPPGFDEIRDALADHNGRGIGIGANAIGHDRGIRNP